ncbi:DNA binding domain-containing protein, excisionase family [Thermostaphylospora chromogena]|uniref:DNA binding domain-containing protein, excisionase family n=2 Tax=Thermostaphylospora chromogena TaxID=35622 RepID=A0A1H1EHV8_9ACTN|nr:DNA binding domain-containing protein, excisionase family [Thermostaphylospora chromogena]
MVLRCVVGPYGRACRRTTLSLVAEADVREEEGTMAREFYSVEQVAERLGLHVRTVRNYVRDGRLKATRIGRRYRIAREDLDAFIGRPAQPPAVSPLRAEVSTVVRIEEVDPETMSRISTLLMTASNTSQRDGRLHLTTHYDEERSAMRIVALGDPKTSADLLALLDAFFTADRA